MSVRLSVRDLAVSYQAPGGGILPRLVRFPSPLNPVRLSAC